MSSDAAMPEGSVASAPPITRSWWKTAFQGFAEEPIAVRPWDGRLGACEYAFIVVSLGVLVAWLPALHVLALLVAAGLVYAIRESSWSPNRRLGVTLAILVAIVSIKYGYPRGRLRPIEAFFALRSIDFVRGPRAKYQELALWDRVGRFVLWLFFLPTLGTGPLVSYDDFYRNYRPHMRNRRQLLRTMSLRIVWGIAKILIAVRGIRVLQDGMLVVALTGGTASGWPSLEAYDGRLLVAATMALDLFRVYFSFSGMIDIVIGLSRLLGFNLPENFDDPLLSSSPVRYWHASNITVYRWLMVHVFFRYWGHTQLTAKVVTTFLASGLWHLTLLWVPGWEAALQVLVGTAIFGLLVAALIRRAPRDRMSRPPQHAWIHSGQIAATFSVVAFVQWIVSSGVAGRPLATTLAAYRVLLIGR